jgi:predicted nuclease of predicted toxin-antitoxin system
MLIKLDENLPSRLAGALTTLGRQIDTVPDEGLTGQADSEVWGAAQAAGRFLITQDLDFSDMRLYQPGTHPGILLLRLRNPGRNALYLKVVSLFENEAVDSWAGCFVVATERKLRIRRPS